MNGSYQLYAQPIEMDRRINWLSVKLSWQNTAMKQYLGPGQASEMGMEENAWTQANTSHSWLGVEVEPRNQICYGKISLDIWKSIP